MPCFNCEKCGVIENTAVSNYWTRNLECTPKEIRGKALCSQCDPTIGRWHDSFARVFKKVPKKHRP